jgi:hypothetical protein
LVELLKFSTVGNSPAFDARGVSTSDIMAAVGEARLLLSSFELELVDFSVVTRLGWDSETLGLELEEEPLTFLSLFPLLFPPVGFDPPGLLLLLFDIG